MPGFSREEMSEFEEMLRRLTDSGNRAADAQDELADEAEGNDADGRVDAAGEGGGAEGPSAQPFAAGFGFGAGAGAAVGAAGAAGVQVINRGADAFGQGAGADALEASALVQAKEEFAKRTPFGRVALATSGVAAAFNNAEQAGGKVGNRLAQLAEQGVEITDEDITRQLEFEAPRIARANAVRARTNALAVKNLSEGAPNPTAKAMLAALEKIVQLMSNGGGGA